MKAKMFAAALATCLLISTSTLVAEESAEGGSPKTISVNAAAQMRFGVEVAILKGAAAPAGVATTARVLDPSPLLQLDSELAVAAASFSASRAEAQRMRKLYSEDRTASARAVDAANAQERADLERVNAVQRRLAIEWGGGLAYLPAHRRAELVNDLAHAQAVLLRVEIPAEAPFPTKGSGIEVHGNAESDLFAGAVLGALPIADPRLQTRGVLVELKGAAAKLSIGQMLSAQIPTADTSADAGVVLPRSALLRRNARVWVYVQTAPNTFVRREVLDSHPVAAGWFVGKGFTPGDHVVVGGAAALLGVESPAAADSDED
jgi:hypothetical protein